MIDWSGESGFPSRVYRIGLTGSTSHGRDHKLRVWQTRSQEFAGLSTKLPADGALPDQSQPWLLHSLSVNALNFCTFSICEESATLPKTQDLAASQLLVSPNGLDTGGIDIFQLPSEQRISQIHSSPSNATGMVMAVSLFHDPNSSRLVLVSGYEDGQVMVHCHEGELQGGGPWETLMACKPHSQPVLSIDVSLCKQAFFSSGADATVAKFAINSSNTESKIDLASSLEKTANTKHAGQQGLSVRGDGKIFATAGWDGRVRVYSCKTLRELAVLKWHKLGCYTTAFADIEPVGGVAATNRSTSSGAVTGTEVETSTLEIVEMTSSLTALDTIKREREEKARLTHWLAAGGKDAKISLWDIY